MSWTLQDFTPASPFLASRPQVGQRRAGGGPPPLEFLSTPAPHSPSTWEVSRPPWGTGAQAPLQPDVHSSHPTQNSNGGAGHGGIPHTSEPGPTPRIPESPGGPWKLCKVQGSTRPCLAVPGPSPPPPSQGGKAKIGARCPTEGNGDTPSRGPGEMRALQGTLRVYLMKKSISVLT